MSEPDFDAMAREWLIVCNHHACHLDVDPNDGQRTNGEAPLGRDVSDLSALLRSVHAQGREAG